MAPRRWQAHRHPVLPRPGIDPHHWVTGPGRLTRHPDGRSGRTRRPPARAASKLSFALVDPRNFLRRRPGVGPPVIVSIGDSSIPGEAGRWAGNTNRSFAYVDTGPNAYLDLGYGESIVGCHRSNSAEVHIGVPGVLTKNLACSGAMPRTYEYGSGNGRRFKPGLDTFAVFDSSGNLVTKGQLLDKLECVAQARAASLINTPFEAAAACELLRPARLAQLPAPGLEQRSPQERLPSTDPRPRGHRVERQRVGGLARRPQRWAIARAVSRGAAAEAPRESPRWREPGR